MHVGAIIVAIIRMRQRVESHEARNSAGELHLSNDIR